MSLPDELRFPKACPACSAVCAKPSMVTAQADGGTIVIIQCRQCGTETRLQVPADTDPAHMRSGVHLPLARPPKQKEET